MIVNDNDSWAVWHIRLDLLELYDSCQLYDYVTRFEPVSLEKNIVCLFPNSALQVGVNALRIDYSLVEATYPLVICCIANWKMAIAMVDLPIKTRWFFLALWVITSESMLLQPAVCSIFAGETTIFAGFSHHFPSSPGAHGISHGGALGRRRASLGRHRWAQDGDGAHVGGRRQGWNSW